MVREMEKDRHVGDEVALAQRLWGTQETEGIFVLLNRSSATLPREVLYGTLIVGLALTDFWV